jgi:hypothetical protein
MARAALSWLWATRGRKGGSPSTPRPDGASGVAVRPCRRTAAPITGPAYTTIGYLSRLELEVKITFLMLAYRFTELAIPFPDTA